MVLGYFDRCAQEGSVLRHTACQDRVQVVERTMSVADRVGSLDTKVSIERGTPRCLCDYVTH